MLIINHTGKYLLYLVYVPVCCFIIGEYTTFRSMGKYCLTGLKLPIVSQIVLLKFSKTAIPTPFLSQRLTHGSNKGERKHSGGSGWRHLGNGRLRCSICKLENVKLEQYPCGSHLPEGPDESQKHHEKGPLASIFPSVHHAMSANHTKQQQAINDLLKTKDAR